MKAHIFLYFDAFNVIPLGLSYERTVYLKRDLKNDISSQLQLGGLSRDVVGMKRKFVNTGIL